MELLTVVDERGRVMRWRRLALELDHCQLRVGSDVVATSRAEFGLLHLLISRRNLPLSKEAIMAWLFGEDHGRDLRQVDMFVARLRRSLAGVGLTGLISTVAGRGYAVLDDDGSSAWAHEARPRAAASVAVA